MPTSAPDSNSLHVAARGGYSLRIKAAWSEAKVASSGPAAEAVGLVERAEPPTILERIQEGVAAFFFFATFLTIGIEVIARYSDHPVVWALELPTYCFLWAWSLAAGLADWENDQLAFDLLSQRLPAAVRVVLQSIADVIIVVVFLAVLPVTISYPSYQGLEPNDGLPLTQLYGDAGAFLLFALGALLRARVLWLRLRGEQFSSAGVL